MNDALSDASSRLDTLEMRIAHQDKTIADMNDVITSQWQTIDALQRHVMELREDFRNIVPLRTTPEPAPPHY
jgi:SlyX protein